MSFGFRGTLSKNTCALQFKTVLHKACACIGCRTALPHMIFASRAIITAKASHYLPAKYPASLKYIRHSCGGLRSHVCEIVLKILVNVRASMQHSCILSFPNIVSMASRSEL